MNDLELRQFLARANLADPRVVIDEGIVQHWRNTLDPYQTVKLSDAIRALEEHHRTPEAIDRAVMPAHIIRTVKRYQEARELDQTRNRDDNRALTSCTSPACRCTHTACDGVWLAEQQITIHHGRQYRQTVRCPECTHAAHLQAVA